ncbi:MAG: aminoacyl-tRNA hydrolase [Deltaproteobacteria bacterium]|nr:aminoacyl-tRNA hydrolase [Deltaproteobacteria bacterium]
MATDTFTGWLVVGLGNPEDEYGGTRHNAGFDLVDLLARRWDARGFANRFHGRFSQAAPARIDGPVLLLKPMTYMNLSGRAVQGAMAFYRILPARVLVIHDDMDLPLGALRLKVGGGSAGHRGIESIAAAVGAGFLRLRLGIGRPERSGAVDHVLSRFDAAEREAMDLALGVGADLVEAALRDGPQAAMNAFHRRRKPEEPVPPAGDPSGDH